MHLFHLRDFAAVRKFKPFPRPAAHRVCKLCDVNLFEDKQQLMVQTTNYIRPKKIMRQARLK